MLSEEETKKRLKHQNRCFEEHLRTKEVILLNFHGVKLMVPPNVFAPPVAWKWHLLSQTVLMEVKESDKVLDMGTGSGIQAIFAASKSKDVTAVDVNPFAVDCAKMNVQLNGFSSRVKVMESNLFENVEGKFDLVIFDPPYRWTKPRDEWEICSADEGYMTLQTFLAKVKDYLTSNGRVLMSFGTSGDLAYFKVLIRKNGFKRKQMLKSKKNRRGWIYFTYKLIVSHLNLFKTGD
jgi:release factor glutamine methyltransferase